MHLVILSGSGTQLALTDSPAKDPDAAQTGILH
jgi:hypothetical protein